MPRQSQPTRPQMPQKKLYGREFKFETLRSLKSSGKTKADLERELVGSCPGQLRLWERAFNREEGDVERAFHPVVALRLRGHTTVGPPW